ncbi:uncharacterized protein LOC134788321, partial [Penaeus indicus]|uniref:uncharacterized protein LOC134788321 n=1 Tax=Penaeus indicus TaxID=29960 RepID=UPI00300CEBDE
MATGGLSVPTKLVLRGDTDEAWKNFKQKFNLYMLAAGYKTRTQEEKVAILLTKFDSHFAPRENTLISGYKYRRCQQSADMTIDTFITKLKNMVKDCGYGDKTEEHLCDQLVFGCRDEALREKFFKEETLSFNDAMKICVAHQATQKQMSLFQEGNSEVINRVNEAPKKIIKKRIIGSSEGEKKLKECKFCGKTHPWKKQLCPAYDKTCSKCGNENHFAQVCKSKVKHKEFAAKKKIHNVAEDDSSEPDDEDKQYIRQIKQCSKENFVLTEFKVGSNSVQFQLDSGASVNVIPRKLIPKTNLMKTDAVLCMWNATNIYPLGERRIDIKNCSNGKKYSVNFIVVEQDFTPILGKRACEQMDLIK